jgi:hypothetical protein
MALASAQPLTEISTRSVAGDKGRSAREADNLTAICEPKVPPDECRNSTSFMSQSCASKSVPIHVTPPSTLDNLATDRAVKYKKTKSVALVRKGTYRPSEHRLSAKLVPTFADRGYRVVSATEPDGRILGFLDLNRYYFFQVAPQLYSQG